MLLNIWMQLKLYNYKYNTIIKKATKLLTFYQQHYCKQHQAEIN